MKDFDSFRHVRFFQNNCNIEFTKMYVARRPRRDMRCSHCNAVEKSTRGDPIICRLRMVLFCFAWSCYYFRFCMMFVQSLLMHEISKRKCFWNWMAHPWYAVTHSSRRSCLSIVIRQKNNPTFAHEQTTLARLPASSLTVIRLQREAEVNQNRIGCLNFNWVCFVIP